MGAPASSPLALAVTVLLAVGCARGGGDAPISEEELPSVVLQPADLAPGFERFDRGRQVRADARQGPRADPARFGRVGGWKARYRRPGPDEDETGALVVESRADLFENTGGAKRDLEAYEQELGALAPGGQRLDSPPLGDGAVAVTFVHQALQPVRFYAFAWREENATASVVVNGFDRRLTLADALALARRQQARLAAAAR